MSAIQEMTEAYAHDTIPCPPPPGCETSVYRISAIGRSECPPHRADTMRQAVAVARAYAYAYDVSVLETPDGERHLHFAIHGTVVRVGVVR